MDSEKILNYIKMEWIIYIIQFIILITLPIYIYIWIDEYRGKTVLLHSSTDLILRLKQWWAAWSLKKSYMEKTAKTFIPGYHALVESIGIGLEQLRILKDENSCDSMSLYGVDHKGNSLYVKLTRRGNRLADLLLQFKLADGKVFVLPEYPDAAIAHNTKHGWSTPWLTMEMLEPMNRWRLIYNGLLWSKNVETTNKIEHVRLNCIFMAGSLPIEWPHDWSIDLHAQALAREPWKNPEWIKKIKLIDSTGYDQWGSLIGEMIFEDLTKTQLYLRGIRLRRWGKHEFLEFHQTATFVGTTLQGNMIYIAASCPKHGFTRLQSGHIKDSNDRIHQINWTDFNVTDYTSHYQSSSQNYQIQCKAAGKVYKITMKYSEDVAMVSYNSGDPTNWTTEFINIKLEINGQKGTGMLQLSYLNKNKHCGKMTFQKICYKQQSSAYVQSSEYIIALNDRKCQDKNLVGGKGASLALLSTMNYAELIVPAGFCITVYAYQLQLKTDHNLQCRIKEIENICNGKTKNDLKKYCDEIVLFLSSIEILEKLRNIIIEALEELESQQSKTEQQSICRYAIRSSAIGEDSEETSTAGQNATYLGIHGVANIIKSIVKCWASLFSYQSVEYRRQHGLPINSFMAVCVQKMVNAEAAGVLFTRYPTTGNPSQIVINANYGLGETVVSGAIEPDTILIHRSWNNILSVQSSISGKKTKKMIMNINGVITMPLNSSEIENVCITYETALKIAKIGLYVESLFGMAMDIEWAIKGEQIFLLQARPITSLNSWTDFELMHELDLGVPNDQDLLTFANVDEVLFHPCPLTISSIGRLLNVLLSYEATGNPYASYIHVTAMRLVMNYFNTILRKPTKTITLSNKVVDIAVCGHIVLTPEIHQIAVERNGILSGREAFKLFIKSICDSWNNTSMLQKAYEFHRNFVLNVDECTSTHAIYENINKSITKLTDIIICHTHTSRVSVFYQILSMLFLTEGEAEFTPLHFADIAIVLSSCSNVISCEIPIALRKITQSIKESGKAEEFRNISASEAFNWLKVNCPVAAKQLELFLEKHGHRCIKELDIYAEPWNSKPESLLSTIQVLVMSEENYTSKELNVEESIASLKTPKKNFTKWVLKKLIPFCRTAVAKREETKDLFVSAVYKVKSAYKRLCSLMFSEGYLPDMDLFYFLTHQEIGTLVKNRSPNLIKNIYL
ncbi:rifampicin phosphotransferase-like isoform X2 [Prorops nasuta]|uniref:rifampicin phosphotransferase-like isoform X2 n=1 Tax=Prorops nasuta TaxID=863751 RepID=UPI0034CE3397